MNSIGYLKLGAFVVLVVVGVNYLSKKVAIPIVSDAFPTK